MSLDELKTKSLFKEPSSSIVYSWLLDFEYPWLATAEIESQILLLGKTLNRDEYENCGGSVWISRDATVASSAEIKGPCIIDKGAEVRHCAYIRGNVIVGKGAVVGNSTELKSSILFDGVQVPHYNYVGNSILGYKAHMGAGSITSNVKGDKTLVFVNTEKEKIETGLKKLGAMIGDYAEIGCGAVLNPGTVIGKGAQIYPLSMVRGYVPKNSIYKASGNIVKKN